MWLMTVHGFFSVSRMIQERHLPPKKRYAEPLMQIRSRDRSHLENLIRHVQLVADIVELPDRDYRYRVYVPRKIWTQIATQLASEIDYDNFKEAVGQTEMMDKRRYLHALHDVWSRLYTAYGGSQFFGASRK